MSSFLKTQLNKFEFDAQIFIVYFFIFLASVQLLYSLYLTWRTKHIGGPWPFPVIGHIPYLLSSPWLTFAKFSKKHGALYKVWVWNKLYVVVSDPQLVQEMFNTRKEKYPKDQWSYTFMADVLGKGLVTSEGEIWKKHKDLLKPAFHFTSLERLHSVFSGAAMRLLDKVSNACNGNSASLLPSSSVLPSKTSTGGIDGSAELELSTTFRQVTLEVISEITLGFSPERAGVFPSLFESILDELNHRVFQPYRAFFPTVEKEHRRKVNELNEIVFQMIRTRRAEKKTNKGVENDVNSKKSTLTYSSTSTSTSTSVIENTGEGNGISLSGKAVFEGGTDMLDMLIESGGSSISDDQIVHELKTQLLAGHETSSMMLTWATHLLATHPKQLALAVEEVDRVLGKPSSSSSSSSSSSPSSSIPPFSAFKELVFLEQCLKEAMRLYSPVPVLARECCEDDRLNGILIPKGTAMLISIWAMHTSSTIWGSDVQEFRPSRFSREESSERHPYAFMPFSKGPRDCIGQHLAISEAKVILGSLLRNYTLQPKKGEPIRPETDSYIIPVRPMHPLHVILTRRN
jgi:cytochrome P450